MTAPRPLPPCPVPVPCQWWLVRPEAHDLCGVTIDRLPQREGPDLYAVNWRGHDLSVCGEWDWRPIPSSRTDEWLTGHRFRSFDEALAAWRRLAGGALAAAGKP